MTKEPCPKCGSRDNLVRYEDNHAWCFTPGCGYYEHGDGTVSAAKHTTREFSDADFIQGEPEAIRGITEETCAKWGYVIGTDIKGDRVHVASYRDDSGRVVAQKLRKKGKKFTVLGDAKSMRLYGQHLWRDGGKMVVVTEGEIDALSVSQLQGNKWPVVSIPNGAQSAKKSLAGQLEWLLKFDHVILMFDNDDAGHKATEECAPIFPPGRCKIAKLPLKDANEMLKAGRGAEVIDAIWGAKEYRPDGIVSLSDLRDVILQEPEVGLPWAFPQLNELTYGRRPGEVHTLGGGTGCGKTDFLTQQMSYDVLVLKQSLGIISFEQAPGETGKRIAGKIAGKQFHIPKADWTEAELMAALDQLDAAAPTYLFDHWGMCEWEIIKERIRYLVHAKGVTIIYLDHLTALAAGAEDERKALETLMAEVAMLAQELHIVMHIVSHLTTPDGTPHEEGGRVMIRHFKGSRAIGFWSHFMYGLERDTQAEDADIRSTTTIRLLKARLCGWNVGKKMYLKYDEKDGLLRESADPFGDETADGKSADEF